MTAVVEENTAVVEDEDTKGAASESDNDDDDDDSKSRDFTKHTEKHKQIADFINANEDFKKAELGVEVTGNLVKAIFALRTDFNNTPEQKAAREERKKRREEEAKKYEGLTPEQIKAQKAADRAQKQADKLQERLQEALAKAQRLREGKDATGEDVAAAVEAQQGDAETAKPEKRTIGRKR